MENWLVPLTLLGIGLLLWKWLSTRPSPKKPSPVSQQRSQAENRDVSSSLVSPVRVKQQHLDTHLPASRPANELQKEFFHFFDMPWNSDLDYFTAQERIDSEVKVREKLKDNLLHLWYDYEDFLNEIQDPDYHDDLISVRPSFDMIRQAVEHLESQGFNKQQVYGDTDQIMETILELSPNLLQSA